MSLKTKTKILVTKMIWLCSRVFWVFPIEKNKVFFLSYNGKQYSDSPKYISDYYLNRLDPPKIVWGFDKDFDLEKTRMDSRIITCKKGTFSYLYHLFSSKEIVINDFISTLFSLRPGQILINTWHGGGTFKTIGMSRSKTFDYDPFFYKAHADNTSAFSLSSEYFKETVVTRSFLFYGETVSCGMPRNAVLFQSNNHIKRKVREYFSIPNETFIVLYAPTYRNYTASNSMDSDFEIIDFNRCRRSFERRFGRKVVILNRSHHIMHKSQSKGDCLEATNYPDMQELIIASDVLISDYSSCMWDYALTQKPIFVYAPDLHTYEENIDFFMPASEWAFSVSMNNDELEHNIIAFNEELYQRDLKAYMGPLRSYECADSVEKICKWLDEKRKVNK